MMNDGIEIYLDALFIGLGFASLFLLAMGSLMLFSKHFREEVKKEWKR